MVLKIIIILDVVITFDIRDDIHIFSNPIDFERMYAVEKIRIIWRKN